MYMGWLVDGCVPFPRFNRYAAMDKRYIKKSTNTMPGTAGLWVNYITTLHHKSIRRAVVSLSLSQYFGGETMIYHDIYPPAVGQSLHES